MTQIIIRRYNWNNMELQIIWDTDFDELIYKYLFKDTVITFDINYTEALEYIKQYLHYSKYKEMLIEDLNNILKEYGKVVKDDT